MKFLILVCLIFAVAPVPRSWSSPACNVNLSVSAPGPGKPAASSHKSVSEALKGEDEKDPFSVFAQNAAEALLQAVKENLCTADASDSSVSLEVRFVRLELMASEPEIGRLQTAMSEMRGSYADVIVDRARGSVKATIVWNPRRMLRDQLAVRGWKFDEDTPLLPLSQTRFRELRKLTYAPLIVEKGNMSAVKLKIGGAFPDEMYGLLIAAGKTRPRSQGTSDTFPVTVRWLIQASRRGYSAMTEAAILRAFKSDHPQPLISVVDIQSSKVRDLYEEGKWSEGVMPVN